MHNKALLRKIYSLALLYFRRALRYKAKADVMKYDQDKIREAIGVALKDSDIQPAEISDVAFHMTDWLVDLEEWTQFCENPESLSAEQVHDLLMGFLIHVPNHVAAASKLFTGFPVKDTFNVGATVESED